MKKVAIITLGCKTNQYESQALGELFSQNGYDVSYNYCKADIYILNTCAVTNEAERKSRQTISKFIKLNPKCKIFVCGCASQNNFEQFINLPNVKYVIGNANIFSLFEKVNGRKGHKIEKFSENFEEIHISSPTKARAYIKIQDGCNRYCSYCLIPYLRGKSRSRDIISILNEASELIKNGAKELVLTGIDISDFQIDNTPSLLALLQELDKFNVRYRIGSFEPNILSENFVKSLSKLKYLCPHFHISMQSGCDKTLNRMNRKYTSKFFIQKVKLLRKYFNNPAITTDLIVGFPGETDEEFYKTLSTIKKAKFAQMHIFPYSRRSGTTADKMLCLKSNPEFFEINKQTVKDRMQQALSLARELESKYIKSQNGKVLSLIVEEEKEDFMIGTTENYVKVYTQKCDQNIIGKIIRIKVKKPFKDGVLGEIL